MPYLKYSGLNQTTSSDKGKKGEGEKRENGEETEEGEGERGGEGRQGGGGGGGAVPCDTVTHTPAIRHGSSKECSAFAPVYPIYKDILV